MKALLRNRWMPLLVLVALFAWSVAVAAPAAYAQAGAVGSGGAGNADADTVPRDSAMYLVGYLSSLNAYNAFVALGAIADGSLAGAYDADFVFAIAEEAINQNQQTIATFVTLIDEREIFNAADQEIIEAIVAIHRLLVAQAQALGQVVQGAVFDDTFLPARDATWAALAELLGL